MLLNLIYRKLGELDLDGILVSDQSNISYLTGFPSRDSYLLLSKKGNFFITDFRYINEARRNLKEKEFAIQKVNGSFFGLVGCLASSLKIKHLGFEAKHLPFAEYEKIKEKLKKSADFVPAYDLVEGFRQVKTKNELSKLRKAIDITVQAFGYAQTIIKSGITESELANKLEYFVKEKGAKGFAYPPIIASGENSAFPHHITSLRRLRKEGILLIDMGVEYEGYKSDLTRIFFLGTISPIFRRVYDIVLKAQERAIGHIKPGLAASQIDKIARQYIRQKGYGLYFGHSLGHGIGLDVHEEPHISSKNQNILNENMVFTVEPAIYLPGKFGIRIEDMVLVTSKGAEVLSDCLDKSI